MLFKDLGYILRTFKVMFWHIFLKILRTLSQFFQDLAFDAKATI